MYMGIVGACLIYTVLLLLNVKPDLRLIIAFGMLSYATYAINRVTDFHEDFISHTDRSFFAKRYQNILMMSAIVAYFIVFLLLYPLGNKALFLAVLYPLVGLLYGAPLIPFSLSKKYRRLKEILLIKNVIISLVWAVVVVGLCIIYAGFNTNIIVFSVFTFVFTKVFINTIVFDIRDVEGDKRRSITTIPLTLGIMPTIRLLMLLNILLGVYVLVAVVLKWLPYIALFVDLITIYTHWYLTKINKADKFFYDIIIEGEDIVMAMLAFIGSLTLV